MDRVQRPEGRGIEACRSRADGFRRLDDGDVRNDPQRLRDQLGRPPLNSANDLDLDDRARNLIGVIVEKPA
jgi:hypothetical protein